MIEELEDLLHKEKQALRSGNIGELFSIAASKEMLLEKLTHAQCDESSLQSLRQRLEHNASLANAAGRGLRDALKRLTALREASGPMTSYSRDGSGKLIGAPTPKWERKA